jgi:HPt (histidine-containing phosphotransfer) domain-containing protein
MTMTAMALPTDFAPPIFNRSDLLERAGGDLELLNAVLEVFASERPGMWRDVELGFAEGDVSRLLSASHKLKGALLNLGAARAAEQARVLEAACREGRVTPSMLQRLGAALEELDDELAQETRQ